MRSKEEIRLIAEEIHLNVMKELVREDRRRLVSKFKDYATKHRSERLSAAGIAVMVGSIRVRENEIMAIEDALKTQKAFETYKQKVTERL